jgi:hypothetical protein
MELTIKLDKYADDACLNLMRQYGFKDYAQVLQRSLSLFQVAAFVDSTEGELIARKNGHETKIIVS